MKMFLLLGCLTLSSFYCFAEDSLAKRVTQLETSVASIQTTLNTINQKLTATSTSQASTTQQTGTTNTSQNNTANAKEKELKELSTWQKLYVLMPIVIFLILFAITIRWLRSDGFKLGDALLGDTPVEVEQPNPAAASAAAAAATAAAAMPPPAPVIQIQVPSTVTVSQVDANGNPVMPKSSSRFIALFSGMAAIVISLSLVSYYVYFGIRGGNPPAFDKMFEAILGLGIGMVPYAVNKFTQPSNKQ